jgi:hypothetical protein
MLGKYILLYFILQYITEIESTQIRRFLWYSDREAGSHEWWPCNSTAAIRLEFMQNKWFS